MPDIEKALESFLDKDRRSAYLIIRHLKKLDISTDEFVEHVGKQKIRKRELKKKAERNSSDTKIHQLARLEVSPKCPKCGSLMWYLDVNTNEANQVKYKEWKTVYICQNEECRHDIWSREPLEEVEERINGMIEKRIKELKLEASKKPEVTTETRKTIRRKKNKAKRVALGKNINRR